MNRYQVEIEIIFKWLF